MSNPLSHGSEVLTSSDRWRRWEQRGRDRDALFMRRARWLSWCALAAVPAATVLFLLLR